ncbi:MFS general substrate transporter [Dendrothele bispora CBS 962.96]|uniref:MFS general substrate transporter n=1 Tax=Dendrothele bispora (strain CBS 962.96) TaxID=1314807 RepID=A0A4S8MVR1_DENBC|nr:MFS general substrate transporter [Dendrothele bispora CBS 962.96]
MDPLSPQQEVEPLLTSPTSPTSPTQVKRIRRWEASPYWVVPIYLGVSMARGMSAAPRIQVFKEIACRALDLPTTECSTSANANAVQARAARIQASITTIMSGLSAITTGPWSRWGDIHGRKPVIFLTMSGALLVELMFILVTRKDSLFYEHAESFIIVGPVFDGLLGGISAYNGVMHAYTADCTRHGSRATLFSSMQGVIFIGLALGPWLNGLILSMGNFSPYLPFFMSASTLIILQAYLALVCPESLQKDDAQVAEENMTRIAGPRPKTPLGTIKYYLSLFIVGLLSPISMFAPRDVVLPTFTGRDWNLTLVGAALFIYLVSIGIYPVKYLYGEYTYNWNTEELGFYMSLLWITRAINLLVVVPLIVAYFKPRSRNGEPVPIEEELRFDQRFCQISFTVDASADLLIAILPTPLQSAFIVLSCVTSFTSGANPTLHSLGAVCLHASGFSSEVGSMFGAMAVLSAIAHVISPSVFAGTYGATVGTFSKAIFVVAASMILATVTLLGLIRSRRRSSTATVIRMS